MIVSTLRSPHACAAELDQGAAVLALAVEWPEEFR